MAVMRSDAGPPRTRIQYDELAAGGRRLAPCFLCGGPSHFIGFYVFGEEGPEAWDRGGPQSPHAFYTVCRGCGPLTDEASQRIERAILALFPYLRDRVLERLAEWN
jgi:hypothetical protein